MNVLEEHLNARILGQENPIREIASLLECAFNGMRYEGEPLCSMLFLGPTGVGKTETALLAGEHYFGPHHLARLDMSEFMIPESIDKLLGGKHQGVLEILYDLTGGEGLLLWDELEKAHTLVLRSLLQILSAGRVTLAGGRVLDFSQYVIICTSNVAGKILMDAPEDDPNWIQEKAEMAALEVLLPEIVGRFGLLATFAKLRPDCLRSITQLHAYNVLKIMEGKGHRVEVTERLVGYIQAEGHSLRFGARPIRRKAMEIIGQAILRSGGGAGHRVSGTLDYSPKTGEVGFYV